jgi:hypothetical protein
MKEEASPRNAAAHTVEHAAHDAAKGGAAHVVKHGFDAETLRAVPGAVAKDFVDLDSLFIGQGARCAEMYYDAVQNGAELHNRANEEAVEVVALNMLDIDPKFRDARLAHHEGIVATRTMARLKDSYGQLTAEGKSVATKLQASADAGAREALTALATGTRESYLKTHPDVARRLAVDVAFNVGFENAMSLRGDPGALNALNKKIDERNPWTVANLAVRS